jgi:hypothetical protein
MNQSQRARSKLRGFAGWVSSRQTSPRRQQSGSALQVILAILAGLILVGIVAVLGGTWFVKRYAPLEVQRSGDAERVEVRTPLGNLEVRKLEDIAKELKLPLYPGAQSDKDAAGSVRVRGPLWDEKGGFDIAGGKFSSDAPYETVEAWYRTELGTEFRRQQGKIKAGQPRRGPGGWEIRVEPGGEDVLFTQTQNGRLRGISLGREAGRTTVILFEISEAQGQ